MIRAIVTDIEGTTSDIAFVKNVLFPYARAALEEFILSQKENSTVADILAETAELEGRTDMTEDEIIQTLIRWIDEDRKATPLKTLQGFIWQHGYEMGDFTGHVYEDAAARLRDWHGAGIQLYVYSSGSVMAQKLLFGHSDAGNMTPLFAGYFDTTTGGKREQESYAKIASAIGIPADQILFLSDIIEELDAARAAGMQTTALNRDGLISNANNHTVVTNFSSIQLTQRAA